MTSARISLALVAAALVFAGCGNGSSGNPSSGNPSAGTSGNSSPGNSSSSTNSGTAASNGSTGEAESDASLTKKASKGGSSAGGEGQRPSPGAKQGSSAPQPVGAREPGITPEQRREATVASMTLQSPSSQAAGGGGPQALPAEYTCDGKNTSPALRWQGMPAGTAELVLFAMNLQPVEGKLFFDWAVAGLSPDLEEIEAGELPKAAVVGRNSFGKTGYEICPEGEGETYMFALFALPKKLSPSQGFEPLALRKTVSEVSGNVGLLALSYARG
jgi:phosphatidylethanolamine-binding protein (PEBP) family uncharacterized protein